MYIDALAMGIADIPDPDPEIRLRLREDFEKGGIEELRFQLESKNLPPRFSCSQKLSFKNEGEIKTF